MPKLLSPDNYSLSTKASLAFVVFIFLFLFIKYALSIPNIKEESYNKEIQTIERNLFFIKEQMKMAINSIRSYTRQGVRLNKEKIVSEIKDIKAISNSLKDEELIDVLKKSSISKYCSFQLSSEKILSESIKEVNLFDKNDLTIFNKWKKYTVKNKEEIIQKKNLYLFYNSKLDLKRVLSISCQVNNLNSTRKDFEKSLNSHFKKSLSAFQSNRTSNTVVLWINSSIVNENTRALFEEDIVKQKKRYIIKSFSNDEKLIISNFSPKEIIEARDKKPLEYKLNGEDVLTWVIDLNNSKSKKIHLLIHTVKKESILQKNNADLFILLYETLIAIGISFILLIFIFRKIFKSVEDKTNELELSLEEKEVLLEEKETLLKEIHHRVKNNLAKTITLIELQENDIDDSKTKKVLTDIKERIYAMELLHRKLYESTNLNEIYLKSYIIELVEATSKAYNIDENFIINYKIDEVNLNIETAMPLGLIINELVTNSFKYAFIDNSTPKLSIEVLKDRNEVKLIVKDNGNGFEEEFSNSPSTLGLKLVNTIVKFQLQGELTYIYEEGSKFIIKGKIREDNLS